MKNLKFTYLLALLFIISGGLFAIYYLLIEPNSYTNIQAGSFLDSIPIPFDWVQIGPISYPIQVDNFLVFQEFKSLPTIPNTEASLIYALLVWVAATLVLTLFSEFKKIQFILASIAWILVLTFSGFNGLNIGGQSTNFPLIILLLGTMLPIIYFHVWKPSIRFYFKWLIEFFFTIISLWASISLSPTIQPEIYVAEHTFMIGFALALAWVLWNGHAVLSGIYLLLARVNRNLNLRISIQIGVIALLYLTVLFFVFRGLTGEKDYYFPMFSALFLLFPMGIFGWVSIKEKANQSEDFVNTTWIVKALHLIGFGLALWLVYKLKVSGNQPAEEFFKHILVYSQLGFSLFFMVYLFANFLSIMDSGQAVDKILYKPYSLVYSHVRIGGLIGMLVLTSYTGGIVGVQANAMSTQVLADYYYNTNQKLEASILYENAWLRYRKNPKAKNTTAQLLFQLNRPTDAKMHLEESFSEAPQIDNILLMSERLHRENKLFEAIYYLERGLMLFENDERLLNNLSLLYVKLQRNEEALALLNQAALSNPSVISNRIALNTKLNHTAELTQEGNDLTAQINLLAAASAKGNLPPDGLIESIKVKLVTENSAMLRLAAYRNVMSEKNRTDPAKDLALIDSLAQQTAMASYISDLEETAVIRSMAAGRVSEAVKNLNGLAFRNPNKAGYYLNLSANILAQHLDFTKASNELIAAEEKGFQAFDTHHWSIFGLGGNPEKALEIREEYKLKLPSYTEENNPTIGSYLQLIANFNHSTPQKLWESWKVIQSSVLKTDIAIRLVASKAHGLTINQLKELERHISESIGDNADLKTFVNQPDYKNKSSIEAFIRWIGTSEELTANPYLTPLVFSAVEINTEALDRYEILNAASEFNHDPILWLKKIEAAKELGLDNYAADALTELLGWITEEELNQLLNSNN